jgi:4-amino-4-deoxy-L-arabinose transferase-like glycosyltransferase
MVVLSLVALRLIAATLLPLGVDETYYWYWSRFPSFGYYDHPPMVAWWIWLGTSIFGNGPFGVRAISVLSMIPLSAAVYATGLLIFDRTIAQRAVLWLNAMLLVGVGGILATPDVPAMLFWTLAILSLALVMRTKKGFWWIIVGVFAGLGVLSKLTDLFLGLGLVAALFSFRDLRRWLTTPWPWLGGMTALLVVAPMLLWNADHGWVTFTKQFSRIEGSGLDIVGLLEYVAVQFLLINPFIAVFCGLGLGLWLGRRRNTHALAVLITTLLPLILYFAVHALGSKVQGNWPGPIYPSLALIAAGAAAFIPALPQRARSFAWCRDFAFRFGVAASVIGLIYMVSPIDSIPRVADKIFRGWQALAINVEEVAVEKEAGWIGTVGFSSASELRYHLRDQKFPVIQITERIRYAFAPPPDPALLERPVLIVSRREFGAQLAACVDEFIQLPEIVRHGGGGVYHHYKAYLVENTHRDFFENGCRPRVTRTSN